MADDREPDTGFSKRRYFDSEDADAIASSDELWLPEFAVSKDGIVSDDRLPVPTALALTRNASDAQAGLSILDDAEVHPVFHPPELPGALNPDQAIPLHLRIRLRISDVMLSIAGSVRASLLREQALGSYFNLSPVMLAIGIVIYYVAPFEPLDWVLFLSAALCGLAGLRIRERAVGWYGLMSLTLVFAGMALAQWQVQRSGHPVPLSGLTGQVTGNIIAIDQNRSGAPRYLIEPSQIESLASDELPARIRISARAGPELKIGDRVSGLARLAPINGPAYPGGYDFAFAARINGLGMSGFFMGAPGRKATEINPNDTLPDRFSARVQSIRQNIGDRVRAGLPGEPGDIVVALITGDRSGLSEETQESLRKSGLAHILAISGLHMALVTLTVIWLARLAFVMIPGFVDRHPVRKYAVLAGFVTATAYLMISGQGIATVRAWLMISVMLAASLMDRRAITMRSVTVAALIILALFPASLFNPGFQMSFAAVAALVAVYREWTDFRLRRRGNHYAPRSALANGVRGLTGWFAGLSTTSLVAGTATALFALWHFHRVAPMGLFSNLLAMPIVSIAVMPLALAVMFLMPYGFETLALRPLGMAVEAVLSVSDYINSYEYDFETGLQPLSVLVSAALFLVLACCLRTRLRWLSVLPLGLLVFGLGGKAPLPDLLIAQDGRAIAVRTALLESRGEESDAAEPEGLVLLYPRRSKFITEIWQRAYLPNQAFADHPLHKQCEKDGCNFTITRAGRDFKVAVIYDPDRIADACVSSDFLIAPRLWWVRCRNDEPPKLILKRSDFEARGMHVLTLSDDNIAIETAWDKPVSAFEIADGAEPEGKAGSRPWLARFDNISRRFSPKAAE